MAAFLDVIASANIKDTLSDADASAAVAKVIGQLPSQGHKPEIIGLNEWDSGAPACIKGTVYRFARAKGGGSPVIYDSTRYELLWTRTKTLAKPGFVGRLPGRRSSLGRSKAAIYCFADELAVENTIVAVAHLTAEVQKRDHYKRDKAHALRVARHKLEVFHLGVIARANLRKGRFYALGDFNFDGMDLRPLVSCWVGHSKEEAAGTLGNRAVDYVFAEDESTAVRTVSNASDHDAVVATYIRRRI